MRILLDVDGVLADFVWEVIKVCADKFGDHWNYSDITQFDIATALGYTKEQEKILFDELKKPGVCENMAVIPGAKAAVDRLRELGDLYIVTSPMTSPTWTHERENWLLDNFGIPRDKVIHSRVKTFIRGDCLIDDRADTVEAWAEYNPLGCGFLVDRPWNQHSKYRPRVKSWDDLLCRF